ncbi:MAG: helix-turn-helix domain-containing protein [Scrofimicrobium sp.]
MAEPWLSADGIAAHLGVTKDTVYTWIAEKAMPAHKVGRLWKFQASEIDDWVRTGAASSAPQTPEPPSRVGDHSYAVINDDREE